MLNLTPAANAKYWAGCVDAVRGGLFELCYFSCNEFMLYSGNFGLHNFIRQSSFDKYSLSTIIADTFSIDT
ncbi:hypothetical protein D3C76_1179090 [compost metagenome]